MGEKLASWSTWMAPAYGLHDNNQIPPVGGRGSRSLITGGQPPYMPSSGCNTFVQCSDTRPSHMALETSLTPFVIWWGAPLSPKPPDRVAQDLPPLSNPIQNAPVQKAPPIGAPTRPTPTSVSAPHALGPSDDDALAPIPSMNGTVATSTSFKSGQSHPILGLGFLVWWTGSQGSGSGDCWATW